MPRHVGTTCLPSGSSTTRWRFDREASPHKRRLKCVINISPRRLMTHLLHQMVHYRTTLRGSEQRSATIARITIHTHATILNIKRKSSVSPAGDPNPQARLGAGRYPYSTSSGTKSRSSSVKIKNGVSTNVLSKSNHTHGGGINRISCTW